MTPVLDLRLEELLQLEQHLGLRANADHPANTLKPGVTSPDGVAVVGEHGDLFIGNGANQWERQFRGEVTIPEAWLQGWPRILEARRGEAARRGVSLWTFIAPEKQAVYPDHRWPQEPDMGAGRPLMRLLALPGVAEGLVYPAAALREARSRGAMYPRRNSHWTASGCFVALDLLLRVMGASPLERLRVEVRNEAQDLTSHFFDPPASEDYLLPVPAGEVVEDNQQIARTGRNTGARYVVMNARAPDARTVLVFGDSYAYDAGLTAALSVIFRRVVFIWSKDLRWDLVETEGADVVVWESAERFLASLPSC